MANAVGEYDRQGNHVAAKELTLGGLSVIGYNGQTMVTPQSYNPDAFAEAINEKAAGFNFGVYGGFRTNGPYDLQRTYNDVYEGGYPGLVGAFTPVASFAVGYTSAKAGIPIRPPTPRPGTRPLTRRSAKLHTPRVFMSPGCRYHQRKVPSASLSRHYDLKLTLGHSMRPY